MPRRNDNEQKEIEKELTALEKEMQKQFEEDTIADEVITSKEQWYDLKKYKDEIQQFVAKKKNSLDITGRAQKEYERLYRSVFAGTEENDVERYPHAAEMYKIYKAALISSCLRGYTALLTMTSDDAPSVLKLPTLKSTMTNQFKSMALLENLSGEFLDDWILKGESVGFFKLKDEIEQYRIRNAVVDQDTGEKLMNFTVRQGVKYQYVELERIDPFDFFVDAQDYHRDPDGCTKIIRSWINSKTLLSSNQFPLLSSEEKGAIASRFNTAVKGTNNRFFFWGGSQVQQYDKSYSSSDSEQIEVLTFYGDYVTTDNKVLKNIKAIVVSGKIAYLDYNTINTNRIIYACYKADRQTHRGISPLAVATPVNRLINKVTDLFIQNLDNVCNPIMIFHRGSFTRQQAKEGLRERMLEVSNIDDVPQFFTPTPAAQQGLTLMQMILEQNKNVLGVNQYNSGDTSGAVRTARESAILEQNANARMRVETDVYSYNFLLRLFNTFYAFNRELALACDNPLAPIYADPELKVSISTNASRADEEGEFQRLLQMLQLPISQMIFSNLSPEQVTMAVRYIMAKAELKDGDNLLELFDEEGNRTYMQPDPNMQGNNNTRHTNRQSSNGSIGSMLNGQQ